MATKILLISSVLFVFLLSVGAGQCFADASEQLKQAETYRREGKYEQAEQICKIILKDYPDTDEAFKAQANLVMVYVLWKKQTEADAAYQVLLSEFSGHKDMPDVVNGIAYQYKSVKAYRKAIGLYEYVMGNWPDDNRAIWSQTGLTTSNIAIGNYPVAHMAANKLLTDFAWHKSLSQAVRNVASRWRKAGKYIQKANQLDQFLVDNHPESEQAMWALTDLAKYYIEDGNDTDALAATNTLLADYAEHKLIEQAVHSLASEYNKAGKHDMALELYQHVVDNWFQTEQAMWAQKYLVVLNLEIGEVEAAEAALNKLLEQFSGRERIAQAVYGAGEAYENLQDYEKACEIYKDIVKKWPKSEHAVWAQRNLARVEIEKGKPEDAEAAIEKLLTELAENERTAQAVHNLAKEYAQKNDQAKAIELYRYIVQTWPEHEHALWAQKHLAIAHIQLGDEQAAKDAVDKLLADFTGHERVAQAARYVADQYRALQKYDEAMALYRSVVDRWPKSPDAVWAQRDLAIISDLDFGDAEAANAEIDWLMADFNDRSNLPTAIFGIGERYYNKAFQCENQNREAEAKANFRKAIAVWERIITELPPSPVTPQAYYLSAVCYRRLEEYEQAIEYCQMIVDHWPDYRRTWHAKFIIGRCKDRLRRLGRIPK